MGAMNDTLTFLRNVIESDQGIQDNVSRYTYEDENGDEVEELAIAFHKAPQDMRMPYIVLSALPAEDPNPSLNRFLYNVDVYTDNGDFETAELLTDRVEHLLERLRLPIEFGVGVWREARHIILNDEDPSIQHHHISFIVKYKRIY